MDGWHVGVEELAIPHRRRVAVLVLQQLHPLANVDGGCQVAATLPVPVAVHWKKRGLESEGDDGMGVDSQYSATTTGERWRRGFT